ncbi:hypothetical protein BC832DRAFT_596213 [Gaertneriomyces semiglobifer]|nr:hypothetical protein BC832DRAFT_596213 [Gaertneriomyces semiglobifer]
MSGLNSKTFNGLRVLDNTKLLSPFVRGELKGSGEANIEGFDSAAFNHVSNQHGELLVNSITAKAPLENRLEDGEANVSLLIDEETMELKNGALASKQRPLLAEYPLSVQEGRQQGENVVELKIDSPPLSVNEHGLTLLLDESSLQIDGEGNLSVIHDSFEQPLAKDTDNVVRLNIDSPLVVKDGKLGVDQKEMSKGIGAISVYSAMDEILPGVGDWIDIPDLPGDMEGYIGNATLVKLNVSNDFSQMGGRLQIRSKGLNEIPYYSGLSGFNSSNRFTYNETLSTLTAPRFEAEAVDYSITEQKQLPTAGYVHQLYQSQAGSGIDISEVTNGRKLIKVNHDETSQLTKQTASLAVDAYTGGDGISDVDNVISSKLTYSGSLRREGDQVIGKTVLSASSNVTVVQTNPFSYEVSVLNPQSQIDNLEDKVDDLNEKTDQNKVETDNKLNDLETEDVRLDDRIDGVESRVQQQENKTDLLSNDITTNRSNITALDNAKNQIQGDIISLAGDVTGLSGVVDTVNSVATGVQIAQQVMSGNLSSLQGVVTGIAGEVTGLSSTVAAIQAMPVVCGVIGIGVLAAQDPITGVVTITASSPLMAQSKGTAPVDPILKSDDSILKDNGGGGSETGETAPPVDPPILPPNPPPPPPGGDTLRTTGRTDGNNFPSLDPIPPIFGGNDVRTNEQTWFRDFWGKRWQLLTIEVDGVPKTVLEYDENNLPIVPHGHIDIVHRKTQEDDFSSVLLTHDRHLQSGYQGVRLESMLQVPNLSMLYESWDSFMRPYVESCNYITVGQGLVKTGSTLSLSDDLSTFAKISSIKALGYKDTLSYSELMGLPTLGSLAAKNSIAWTDITSRPTLGTLSSKNTLDWNGTDIINKPTDLTTKTYVDSLSDITVGTGLVKTGSTICLGSDLGAFEVKTNLKALAYKDSLSWNDILSKPTLGALASKSSVSWITEVSGKPDLTIYETKTAPKGLAYKDKVDYATDVINAPATVTYGSGLLFSENTLSTETGGIVIDDTGSVDISQRLSVGTNNTNIVAFPPVNLTSNATTVSARPYGNGVYTASASSNSGYLPYMAFTNVNATNWAWMSANSKYNTTAPYNYIGSAVTVVDATSVSGEWLQLEMPLDVKLTSFDISIRQSRFIKDIVLAGSNDGTTFTMLMSSTATWGADAEQTLSFTVSSNKSFKILRLIVQSVDHNGGFSDVYRLIFNGVPTAVQINGTLSTKEILTENLICSGDVQIYGPGLQYDIPTTSVYPDIPMTAATTGQYTATSSSVYSGTWTGWKVYNPYAPDNNNTWFSATSVYSSTAPYSYIGSVSTTVDGTAVLGEYLQLNMQTAIALTSFYIAEPFSGDSYNVKDFIIAGSSDGSSWKTVTSGTLDWSTAPSNGPICESAGKYAQIYALKYTGGALKKVLNVENLKVNKIFGDLSIDNSVEFKDDIAPIRYPQIQLTGTNTQGYIANASSNTSSSAGWKAFTNSLETNDSWWSSSTYSGGTQNAYQGQVQTTVNGINLKGEYVELEMPEAIAISAFSFAARTPEMPMFPKDYTICASDDRSNWTEISSGTMTYTIYQNSTSVDRYVPIKNYTTKKFKVFRFIVRNIISSTYAHMGKLTFYGSTTTLKIIDAPSAKINNVALTAPAYGMFQLHSSQAFSVNGTAYQLITKWTPSFGMESETITCSPNSQDIVFSMPGIYKIEFDLDCHQSPSGVVNSYFGFMAPGNPQYYEDGYHVRKISMIAGQRVTGSSICRVAEANTKMILRFNSGSSSGAITGSSSSRLIVYRIAPL